MEVFPDLSAPICDILSHFPKFSRLLNVEYRLSQDHPFAIQNPFPAALIDAVTAYNYEGDFTNAGNDWYFENRVGDDGEVDDWSAWVQGASSQAMITIPA